MSVPPRPARLVDYFLTVGVNDPTKLKSYHPRQSRQEEYGGQAIRAITEISIVNSDKDDKLPDTYYCINKTVEGKV